MCLVVMVMIKQVVGLGVVTVLEPKEPILCWTQFLIHTLFVMFPLYMLVGPLLVPPYTSY